MYTYTFRADGTGSLDGSTPFDLAPPTVPIPGDGVTEQVISVASGRINRASMNPVVGTRGFVIRNFRGSVGAGFLMAGIVQPGAAIPMLDDAALVQNMLASNIPDVTARYVPPGWEVVMAVLDQRIGGTPQNGPYQVTMTFEAIPASDKNLLEAFPGFSPWFPDFYTLA